MIQPEWYYSKQADNDFNLEQNLKENFWEILKEISKLILNTILIFKTSQEADFNERKPLDNRQTKEINEGMTEDKLEPSISETSENKSHNETVRSL